MAARWPLSFALSMSKGGGRVTDPFVPFAMPDIGEAEIGEVVDSLKSGWITSGPKVRSFEERFAERIGDDDVMAVAVNSATAGLHLALEAIGIGAGDEVITTTFTFTATAEVIRYLGGQPVFVDIDPNTLCIDPALVAEAVTERTRAIIPVHYGGLACDMDALIDLAARHELRIVEDAAHAFPSHHGKQLVGSLDTASAVFSFYATKTIATGEGGMLVTKRSDIADRARIMRLHGIDRDAFDRYVADRPAWSYDVVAPGFKYNMTDLAAALGLHQLARADEFHRRRVELASAYSEGFLDLPLSLPPSPDDVSDHAWHLYVIRLTDDAPVERNRFIELMFEAGIGCSVHYAPLHLLSYWRDSCDLNPDQFPHAQAVFERCVSLPLYTRLTDGESARIIDTVRELLAG